MAEDLHFVADPTLGLCPSCGSVRGRVLRRRVHETAMAAGASDAVCPSPYCPKGFRPGAALLPGVDPSYLYRGRALLFCPEREVEGGEVGVIRAVPFEHVHCATSRHQALIVVRDIVWPQDRKRFGELFDHHIHHEDAPHVSPLNDGWDSHHGLPVL